MKLLPGYFDAISIKNYPSQNQFQASGGLNFRTGSANRAFHQHPEKRDHVPQYVQMKLVLFPLALS